MRDILTVFASIALLGEAGAQDYSISNWYNDYEACMVQTYDDMNSDHVNICTPQLKARGMGGTMFIDYDQTSHVTLSGGWPGLMQAADDGMEMANHTQTHPDLTAMKNDAPGLVREITTFRDFVNSNVTNQDCNTFAYPYGNGNLDWNVITEIRKTHIGARDAGLPGTAAWGWNPDWIYNFGANEEDYYHIPTIAEHFLKPKIQSEVDNLLQHGGLMTVMWHAVTASDHEAYLDNILAACNGKVWHSNFQDAVKYHRERRVSVLTTKHENGTEWVLNLTDTLNDVIFNHPLTIHLKYGDKIVTGVTQNGVSIDYTTEGDEIVFNAIPDGGEIVVGKQFMVGSIDVVKEVVSEVFPNPATEVLNVKLVNNDPSLARVFNSIGAIVQVSNLNSGIATVDVSQLEAGNYILEVVNVSDNNVERVSFVKR